MKYKSKYEHANYYFNFNILLTKNYASESDILFLIPKSINFN